MLLRPAAQLRPAPLTVAAMLLLLLALVLNPVPAAASVDPLCYQPQDDPTRDLTPIRATDRATCPVPTVVAEGVHVLDYKHQPTTALLLGNGHSHGLVVRLPDSVPMNSCLRTVARLVVPNPGPKFLHSSAGLPLRSMDDAADGVVFVLSARETWVWPGVRLNYTFVVENMTLTTLSMQPRVFLVQNFLSPSACDAIVARFDKHLTRSPEKHYSPGFENYRTSETGWMSPADAHTISIRHRVQRVLRLPAAEYAEVPQFLRYQVGQWYKAHHDYFHNWARLPASELIAWTRNRVLDLCELNVSVHESGAVQAAARKVRAWINPDSTRRLHVDVVSPAKTPVLALVTDPDRHASSTPSGLLAELCALLKLKHCDSLGDLDLALRSGTGAGEAKLQSLSAVLARHLATELGVDAGVFTWLGDAVPEPDPRLETLALKNQVQCNRHATILPYLNEVLEGGETVLPNALDPHAYTRDGTYPVREGMPDCSRGVVLSPHKGSAALFYHRLGDGALDPTSLHGGCPPARGVKYALNCFTWSCSSDGGMKWYRD